MSNRRERGFTLVELMVVIVLIGLLAGVVGVTVVPMMKKGRKAVALDQMKEIQKALEFYKIDAGSFPESLQDLTVSTDDSPSGYIKAIPLDPWKEPYEYDPSGGTVNEYSLLSKGEDKVAGTDDDVVIDEEMSEGSQ